MNEMFAAVPMIKAGFPIDLPVNICGGFMAKA
jgi:hypothetical protein